MNGTDTMITEIFLSADIPVWEVAIALACEVVDMDPDPCRQCVEIQCHCHRRWEV